MLTSGAVLSLDDIDDARDQRASREDEIRQQDDQQARKMERRRTQEAQRRERQRSYVRRLVDDSHGVEMARMLILANRSVKTWSEQMNQRIIAAYIDLRDIRHDQQTSIDSGHPIFPDWGKIEESFGKMEGVLKNLIDEYGANKKDLSELQLKAEKRRSLQSGCGTECCSSATSVIS